MATASPTPLPSYGNGRITRQPSMRPMVRRDSPLSALGHSSGFSANAKPLQSFDVGDSSDDERPQPMKLSAYTEALLAQNEVKSPDRPKKLVISRNPSASNTPKHDTITPAPSIRVKRVPLRGAPMRRIKRTPQGDEDHPPSQDQENLPMSVSKVHSPGKPSLVESISKPLKPQSAKDSMIQIHREDKLVPLQPMSTNTPHRPAPPPPPKMSILETATVAAGASTTKTKRRKNTFVVNGKAYTQLGKLGRGGSGDVYRVMAENCRMFALKRVKLADADESAVRGYKGEIDLLRKLENVSRVVRLYDWEIDEKKDCLSFLMEMGDADLDRILKTRQDPETHALDIPFIRFYWKEILECVLAIHEHNIVHSDLKPANFVSVQGTLKLIDFGIADAIQIDQTVNVHRDSHVGTPNYMSPESLSDTNVHARRTSGPSSSSSAPEGKIMKLGKPSDVWSLGCILYRMVYGKPPFAHIPNQIHRVMAIINPAVAIAYPDHGIGGVRVPWGLKRTLRACLNRNSALRPTIPQLLASDDPFLYPDAGDDLVISQELLGQVIQRVAERFREDRGMPDEEEIAAYAGNFYGRIRELLERP
ncbi:kinase-like protein [Patellaria atrata CBS 101060]|uniref:Kinase-like protein n=1 Tax=Patellaria atrata CBS 101060 TaxID=1346257 RepID=A0A9P4VM90_9PEZI|nr:kinase-like protein [Patellaria atrata CBS 101060]